MVGKGRHVLFDEDTLLEIPLGRDASLLQGEVRSNIIVA